MTVPAIASFLNIKYKYKDKKRIKKINSLARFGNLDIASESTLDLRSKRQEASLNFDLEKQSQIQKWEHNPKNENQNDDWERVDYFD